MKKHQKRPGPLPEPRPALTLSQAGPAGGPRAGQHSFRHPAGTPPPPAASQSFPASLAMRLRDRAAAPQERQED
ncbi:hypothetical protein NDU88_003958 [Pleurodeles waltl]|uniref:Uncharacterized protein n=1 Tax=Pleurodeles waltl TaxID=8319 RepID=A0AAV7TR31_PLEWA|nr:hypothetical protein NDU88_003958 [Pleurodeles waltl]